MGELQKSHFLIYRSEDGKIKLDVRFEGETVWLTQAMIVELFQSSKSSVSEHIKHIFEEGELTPEAVVRNFRTTASGISSPSSKICLTCSLTLALLD